MYLKDNSTTKYYFTVFKNCEMNNLCPTSKATRGNLTINSLLI